MTLANPTTSRPTFTAAAGQTYNFLLVVKDDHGGQGQARVRISTNAANRAEIVFFTATPAQITAGQAVTLSWKTTNADTANIAGIGNVAVNGSITVSPTQTTTYTSDGAEQRERRDLDGYGYGRLDLRRTACELHRIAREHQRRPVVDALLDQHQRRYGQHQFRRRLGGQERIGDGEPVADHDLHRHRVGGGASTTCAITVTVGALPVIASFTANPASISAGQSSTLQWSVQNSTSVSISSIGTVSASGTRSVSPTVTTVYTLTATNAAGSTTRPLR